MGLIKAFSGAVSGTFADQYKEFFYCDSIDKDVLMVKGQKRSTARGSNTKGNPDVISNGSAIAVADGQCMIIVEQGMIVEVSAEPGIFVYNTELAPSIFTGGLGKSIIDTFKMIGRRTAFGGETGTDQRVYYFNLKEMMDNKYGTQNPVPFRVVDKNIGLDIDISIRCNGAYSYKIENPLLFYKNVTGNVSNRFTRAEIDAQLKTELLTALQPAFAKISEMGVRYSALPGHTMELADALNQVLSPKWKELRGISIVSFGVNSVTANKEDEDMIKQLQRTAVMRNPTMAAAHMVDAQADAMRSAAKNEAGAMMGFMGMNMANQAGGMNAQNLFQMGAQQEQYNQQPAQQQAQNTQDGWRCNCGEENTGKFCKNCGKGKPAPQDSWKCSCGEENSSKFCKNCGKTKPVPQQGWSCKCGAINEGNFCKECGTRRPAQAPMYKCDKCGWKPADPSNPPKFCPECGDVFDDNDLQ